MSQDSGPLRDRLLHNDEYRRLDAQHHEYESRLVTLADKARSEERRVGKECRL